jgi:hypothetical protein
MLAIFQSPAWMSSWLGTGKSITFFTVNIIGILGSGSSSLLGNEDPETDPEKNIEKITVTLGHL